MCRERERERERDREEPIFIHNVLYHPLTTDTQHARCNMWLCYVS